MIKVGTIGITILFILWKQYHLNLTVGYFPGKYVVLLGVLIVTCSYQLKCDTLFILVSTVASQAT